MSKFQVGDRIVSKEQGGYFTGEGWLEVTSVSSDDNLYKLVMKDDSIKQGSITMLDMSYKLAMRRVKDTKLARRLYPDAKSVEGYLEVNYDV